MSDFFTSLVDRALDRTPVLERRQPTLFEPKDDIRRGKRTKLEESSPLEEEEILTEGRPSLAERKYAVDSSLRLPQQPLRREQTESQPVEVGPVSRAPRHDSPASPRDRITARVEPVDIATRKEAAKEVTPQESSRELQPRTKEPEQIATAPVRSVETIVERRVEREIIKEHSTDEPAIKEVHTLTQVNEQSKPSREKDSTQPKQPLREEVKQLTPSIERRTSERSIGQKPSPPQNQPKVTRAVPRAEAKDSSEQTTAPVIHVTIGRVEVRATPPATKKPRAAQSAGPKMSLEDYLRARVEGK